MRFFRAVLAPSMMSISPSFGQFGPYIQSEQVVRASTWFANRKMDGRCRLTRRPRAAHGAGHVSEITDYKAFVDGQLALNANAGPASLAEVCWIDIGSVNAQCDSLGHAIDRVETSR